MDLLWWMHKPAREIATAREEKRVNRGELATRVVQLDQQRHLLDEMVKRSLDLMEPKK